MKIKMSKYKYYYIERYYIKDTDSNNYIQKWKRLGIAQNLQPELILEKYSNGHRRDLTGGFYRYEEVTKTFYDNNNKTYGKDE